MKGMPHFRHYPMGDVVNANLEPGEYVLRRNAVNALGVDNMELLNHADGAHGALNKLMVSASLVNHQTQSNEPVKTEANGFPIADSPVRQRVDATRQMQEGGPVEDDMARQWQDYRSGVGAASMMEREAEAADPTLVPAGKNIFGQSTEAMTQSQMSEMLLDMMTGVGGTVKKAGKGIGNIPIPDNIYSAWNWWMKTPKPKGIKKISGTHRGPKIKNMTAEQYENLQMSYGNKIQKDFGKKTRIAPKRSGLGQRVSGEVPKLKGKYKEEAEQLIEDVGPSRYGEKPIREDLVDRLRSEGSEYDLLSDVLGYQDGGEVSKTIRGARPVEYNYDDPEMLRGLFSVPASEVGGGEGLRYYSAEKAQGRMPSLDRRVVQARAAQKMAFSPADSIPSAMVEGYFDEPSKASGFLKRLGINKQEGGQVYGYKEGGQVKGDKALGDWGGEQGDYMKALAASQDSTISEQELKSMALMDHFRKMGTGERVESSDVYNGEPAYKSEEAYKRAFGMQTPLNAKERFTQARLGLNPEMFTAQQKGLLGKVLLQRLGNEVQ